MVLTGYLTTTMSGTVINTGLILTPLDVTDPTDPERTGSGNNSSVVSFYYEPVEAAI
jgi:hypothetical protein